MEYHQQNQSNPFDISYQDNQQHFYLQYQRNSVVPVDVRLKENKERKIMLEKERQKEKQLILEKRKEKQNNVQKMLKQRHEAKQNAKMMFGTIQKNYDNKIEITTWKKAQDIDQKIKQCRNRADGYKTLYKKKLHQDLEHRQNSVRERRIKKIREQNEKNLNYHLAEWREYERRIVQKYKQQMKVNNPTRLYDAFCKKQGQLKEITLKLSKNMKQKKIEQVIPARCKSQKVVTYEKDQKQGNPIYSTIELTSLGLTKSIRNPQKLLRELKQFLEEHVMLEEPSSDQSLLLKFEAYLEEEIHSQK